MATLGNSGGRNRGKKYKKLKGFEQATPESEAKARDFMKWYGANYDAISTKFVKAHLWNADIATDTALYIYDCIALKGFEIKDYKFYFLRAYHGACIADKKEKYKIPKEYLDATIIYMKSKEGPKEFPSARYSDNLISPDYNYFEFENENDKLKTEILEYVRGNYDSVAIALFEIYVGLLPNTSYKRLADFLGIKPTKVWTNIGQIRKDVAQKFDEKHNNLLSLI